MAVARNDRVTCSYHRTRADVTAALEQLFRQALIAGHRVLAGFDFPFGYPKGFAWAITGTDSALAVWQYISDVIEDHEDNTNNRFHVARQLNARFPGLGPFWGCPANIADDVLPARGSLRHHHGMTERRQIEALVPRAQPCWKLYTTGSVGSQALLGIPRLQYLRACFGASISVSPFEPPNTPIVLAEVFPSLLASVIADLQEPDEIKDRAQVRILAQVLSRLPADVVTRLLSEGDAEEGWIFGVGHTDLLSSYAGQTGS